MRRGRFARWLGLAWTGGEWPLSPLPVSASIAARGARSQEKVHARRTTESALSIRIPQTSQGLRAGREAGKYPGSFQNLPGTDRAIGQPNTPIQATMGNISARQVVKTRSIYHDPSIRQALQQRGVRRAAANARANLNLAAENSRWRHFAPQVAAAEPAERRRSAARCANFSSRRPPRSSPPATLRRSPPAPLRRAHAASRVRRCRTSA